MDSPAASSNDAPEDASGSTEGGSGSTGKQWEWRPILRDFFHLFALSGFAFAQPLLDLLGNNATFFVAHDVSSTGIILFTLAILFGPPIALTAVVVAARLVSPQVERITMTVLVGALVAFTIVPIVDRSADLPTWLFVILLLGVAAGAGSLYLERARIREFVSWLTPAPLLFAGAFLFATPVNNLVFSSDPAAYAKVAGTSTPVVMVVLDEFSLPSLLDDRGQIDAKRFPSFARLAQLSNWYPNATTVSRSTSYAVPALLSGVLPDKGSVGTAASFPRNLFTLLGRSHAMHVDELVTALCPENICTGSNDLPGSTRGTRALLKDAAIAYLHTLLPGGLEDAWLPPLGERFAGFSEDPTDVNVTPSKSTGKGSTNDSSVADTSGLHENQGQRFDQFIDSLGIQSQKPGLWFLHELLPHIPYTFLPDRLQYSNGVLPVGVDTHTGAWSDSEYLGDLARQQYMLQLTYTDQKIGAMLDRMSDVGLLDRSLLIVTADHGVSFQPGLSLRPGNPESKGGDDILPVPLFVKLPNQDSATVDKRLVQTVDLLPTVADVLDIKLPKDWAPDGTSMVADDKTRKDYVFDKVEDEDVVHIKGPLDLKTATRRFRSVLPPSSTHDLWRLGKYGDMVGKRADGLAGAPADGVSVSLTNPDAYTKVSKVGPVVPARFVASVTGAAPGTPMAIAVNGVVAGTGEVASVDGESQLIVMVDPALMKSGANQVKVYEIDDSGRLSLVATT